ncbi:hypothetical protein [Cryobacterium psychrophilum]|uniref:Uncharacterized protein n=1 Tax=Cryobacterium psychrophilum TaxID=41988 RepID=A0A4Y8KLH4_9MICO|nr:hypothetical protein [Cryobacterium psychrophilum]TDW31299.1 hypothetical protein EDD25_3105 [Cryobacterium psychrophilum]TFD78417.1 hypothetical protein E3T53_09460 [Cryobacterium psychrophilum]
MDLWNNFVSWLTAASTEPVVFSAVLFVIAIVIASVITALIFRATIRRMIDQRDREIRTAAIATLVDAATEASVWNSLTPQEQVMSDRAVGQADIQVRLLPMKGSGVAANWSAHQLAELKRTSATFGYQLEPALLEFRDRLIDWQKRPARARKIFQGDLDRWVLQNSQSDKSLLAEQDAWVAEQHHNQYQGGTNNAANSNARTSGAVGYEPITPAPLYNGSAIDATAPYAPTPASIETQRLLDDVDALAVRSPDALNRSATSPSSQAPQA